MPRPTDAGNFAEAVYSQFPQAIQDIDAANNWDFLIYLGALGQMFQQMDDLAHQPVPWSALLDIDSIPDIGVPWLGQFVGVVVDTSLSPSDQRQQLRAHMGWGRGTVAALQRAVGVMLSGTKTVNIVERDSSPYHFTINTWGTETPSNVETYATIYAGFATYEAFFVKYANYEEYWLLDPQNFIRDIIIPQQKPAGLQFTYTVTAGAPGTATTYEEIFLDTDDYGDLVEAHETYQDVYLYP